MRKQNFKVAGHIFSVEMDSNNNVWDIMQPFHPFMIDDIDNKPIFNLKVVDEIKKDGAELILNKISDCEDGMVGIMISKIDCDYLFELYLPQTKILNCSLRTSKDGECCEAVLYGTNNEQKMALDNALILAYILSTTRLNTIFLHASAVVKDNKTYLFLGKSGTGKSTHTRMWLESFQDAVMLNDDHPIVRIHDNGDIWAYGSPWSGKTICYKNLSFPLGAIVRIVQAPENRIKRMSIVESYASVMTSISGVQWSQDLLSDRAKIMDVLLQKIPNYKLHCLPNHDAAKVCREAVQQL